MLSQAAADSIVVKVNDDVTVLNDVINSGQAPLSTQSSVDEDSKSASRSPSSTTVRRSGSRTSTGVRAKIARRNAMRLGQGSGGNANALDVVHGSLSDQDGGATSENCDEDDSIEEKHDMEPMNDTDSAKHKEQVLERCDDVSSHNISNKLMNVAGSDVS